VKSRGSGRSRDPLRFPLTSARKEQTIKGTHTLTHTADVPRGAQHELSSRATKPVSPCSPGTVTTFVLTLSLVSLSHCFLSLSLFYEKDQLENTNW